jgi:hypothetical protein
MSQDLNNSTSSTSPADASSSTDAQPKLLSEVKNLVLNYNERKDDIAAERDAKRQEHEKRLEENREKGSTALFHHLKGMVIDKVKTYAGYGKSEARIYEFTFGDEIKFENCFAKDLLTKGTVISQLQSWLDAEHSEVGDDGTKSRAFYAYFNLVGRQQRDRTDNKFAVFVNWDQTAWDNIKERLERNLALRSQPRQSRQNRPPRQSEGTDDTAVEEVEANETSKVTKDTEWKSVGTKPHHSNDDSRRPRQSRGAGFQRNDRQPRTDGSQPKTDGFQRSDRQFQSKTDGFQRSDRQSRGDGSQRGRGRGRTDGGSQPENRGFNRTSYQSAKTAASATSEIPTTHSD